MTQQQRQLQSGTKTEISNTAAEDGDSDELEKSKTKENTTIGGTYLPTT